MPSHGRIRTNADPIAPPFNVNTLAPLHMTRELHECAVRARLMDELVAAGVHLALPVGISEVDVLAYTAAPSGNVLFTVPIKVVSMSFTVFASRLARLRSSGLLAVLLQKDDAMPGEQSFAFTPQELVLIQMIGIIERSSVRSVTNSALREAIRPYAMSADTWQRKISAMIRSDDARPAG